MGGASFASGGGGGGGQPAAATAGIYVQKSHSTSCKVADVAV